MSRPLKAGYEGLPRLATGIVEPRGEAGSPGIVCHTPREEDPGASDQSFGYRGDDLFTGVSCGQPCHKLPHPWS